MVEVLFNIGIMFSNILDIKMKCMILTSLDMLQYSPSLYNLHIDKSGLNAEIPPAV